MIIFYLFSTWILYLSQSYVPLISSCIISYIFSLYLSDWSESWTICKRQQKINWLIHFYKRFLLWLLNLFILMFKSHPCNSFNLFRYYWFSALLSQLRVQACLQPLRSQGIQKWTLKKKLVRFVRWWLVIALMFPTAGWIWTSDTSRSVTSLVRYVNSHRHLW